MLFAPASPASSFYALLLAFHAFPLHAPLTLFVVDAPFGRFARGTSRLNLNGNVAWFCMEIVAPTTLLATLWRAERPPLTGRASVLAALYITHYLQRAILSPLVLSPERSPLHVTVPLAAAVWNLTNATLIATQLAFFPPELALSSWRFWAGVAGWALGFAGNVYHDEILNDLRRPREKRLVLKITPEEEQLEKEDKKKGNGKYAIPRGAGFELVSFPNYTCEWFEWISFALLAGPLTLPVPPLAALDLPPTGHSLLAALPSAFWPARLLSPAWMFVLAEVAAMLPRALRGQAWYKRTFGERFPRKRRVVIPWLL